MRAEEAGPDDAQVNSRRGRGRRLDLRVSWERRYLHQPWQQRLSNRSCGANRCRQQSFSGLQREDGAVELQQLCWRSHQWRLLTWFPPQGGESLLVAMLTGKQTLKTRTGDFIFLFRVNFLGTGAVDGITYQCFSPSAWAYGARQCTWQH